MSRLPNLERARCEIDELLGEEEWMTLTEAHRFAAHLGAHLAAEEKRMKVRTLDVVRGHGVTCARFAKLQLRTESHRHITIHFDNRRRRRRHRGLDRERSTVDGAKGGGDFLEIGGHVPKVRPRDRDGLERFEDAVEELDEGDPLIVSDDLRLAACAIHAEGRDGAEALERELPRLVVKSHDRLIFKVFREIEQGPRDVAEHGEGLAFVHARRHVGAAKENVDDLFCASTGPSCARARLGGDGVYGLEMLDGVRSDEDFESVHRLGDRRIVGSRARQTIVFDKVAEIGQRSRTLLAAHASRRAQACTPPASAWGALFAIACALYCAWMWGFTIDDAFISIRYARHLAEGIGYRFNGGGPSTDGVTPLPWPFVLAPLAHAAALDVLVRAKVVNLFAWLASAFALGKRVGKEDASPLVKLAAAIVLALSLPVAAGAVSGMETGVATALATFAIVQAARKKMYFACIVAGISAAFRPEMIVWALVLAGALSVPKRDPKCVAGALARAAAPFVACAVVRQIAFGRFAPLAVLAKPSDLTHGLTYVIAAALVSLTPVLACAPIAVFRSSQSTRAIALAAVAHLFAVAIAGGDWMPYARLVAPIAPSLALVFVLSSSHARPWSSWTRVAASLALGAFVLFSSAPAGRHVERDREALITASRPYLQNTHVVATADIGWPTAATEADIVDLAGLTDPFIAVLPGGHTSKRVEPAMILDRNADVILLYATSGVTSMTLDDWRTAEYGKLVDVRIADSPLISAHFDAIGFLPLGAEGAGYVVLSRSDAQK